MKLLATSLIVSVMLVILIVFGLMSANAAVMVGSYCAFSGIVFPLLWVAIYRFFSRSIEMKWRKEF